MWLYYRMEVELSRTYTGFDEHQVSGVIDAKEFIRFFGNKHGTAAPIANYVNSNTVSQVCLDQPYGLPPESLALNGLPEPDDGISYLSLFIKDGEHYYAIPLDREFYVPSKGCRSPESTLVSYLCNAHGVNKICLRWS